MNEVEFPNCCGLTILEGASRDISYYTKNSRKGEKYDPLINNDYGFERSKTKDRYGYAKLVPLRGTKNLWENRLAQGRAEIVESLKNNVYTTRAGYMIALNHIQFYYFGDIYDKNGFKIILNGAYSGGHGNRIYLMLREGNPKDNPFPIMGEISYEKAMADLKALDLFVDP